VPSDALCGSEQAWGADSCPAPFTQVDAAADPIEDFDADRLFVHRSDGALSIVDRRTRAVTSVVTDVDFQWGRLTAHGVVYVYLVYDATFDERDYPVAIWRDGTLRRITDIGCRAAATWSSGEASGWPATI